MNQLNSVFFLFIALVLMSRCTEHTLKLQTDNFVISLDQKGRLTVLKDVNSGKNYLAQNQETYLLSLKDGDKIHLPAAAQWDETTEILSLNFPTLPIEA